MKNKGTFSLNKTKPFYSWYQYVEGYSEELVEMEINKIGNIGAVYDPFGGSGTTMIYASLNGIKSYFSEINPLMKWVSLTKINAARKSYSNIEEINIYKKEISDTIRKTNFAKVTLPDDGFNKFYDTDVRKAILGIKKIIKETIKEDYIKDLFLIPLISNVVKVSNMQKNGDLRYATEKELRRKNKDIVSLYLESLDIVLLDLTNNGAALKEDTYCLAEDARDIVEEDLVDCIITSPPYLNGTNYIRNTKLELNVLGILKQESSLPFFHKKGIIAGINNVSAKTKLTFKHFPYVDEVVNELEKVTYDKRIPIMVLGYFDNMYKVFNKMSIILKNGGILSLDIGDSQFSGVHIETHNLLEKIAQECGFVKYDEEIVRKRISNGGMVLSQRILRFKLKK